MSVAASKRLLWDSFDLDREAVGNRETEWQRRFAGSRDAIGKQLTVDGRSYTVVGVMPRAFYFMPARDIDMWMPASFPVWMRTNFSWHDAQVAVTASLPAPSGNCTWPRPPPWRPWFPWPATSSPPS